MQTSRLEELQFELSQTRAANASLEADLRQYDIRHWWKPTRQWSEKEREAHVRHMDRIKISHEAMRLNYVEMSIRQFGEIKWHCIPSVTISRQWERAQGKLHLLDVTEDLRAARSVHIYADESEKNNMHALMVNASYTDEATNR
jgi:hypothetical protein